VNFTLPLFVSSAHQFSKTARLRGYVLHKQNGVVLLASTENSETTVSFAAGLMGTGSAKMRVIHVTVSQGKSVIADCACKDAACEHVYAAMLEYDTHETKAAPDSLAQQFVRSGGTLNNAMSAFLDSVDSLFKEMSPTGALASSVLWKWKIPAVPAYMLPQAHDYPIDVRLAPAKPKTAMDFLQLWSLTMIQGGLTLPPGLANFVDVTKVAPSDIEFRRQQEQEHWLHVLQPPAFSDLPPIPTEMGRAKIGKLAIIIDVTKSVVRLMQVQATKIKRIRLEHMVQLMEDQGLDTVSMAMVHAFDSGGQEGQDGELGLERPSENLRRLFRRSDVRERVITAGGKPIAWIEKPIQWDSKPDPKDADYWLLQAKSPVDLAAGPSVSMPIDEGTMLVITDKAIVVTPNIARLPLSLAHPNRVPAAAFRTKDGLIWLQRLGLSLAHDGPTTFQQVKLRTQIQLALVAGSHRELMVAFCGVARPNGEVTELWDGQGRRAVAKGEETHLPVRLLSELQGQHMLRSNAAASRAPAQSGPGEILDHTEVSDPRPFCAALGLGPHYPHRMAAVLRREFPEYLIEWLQSLPPAIEVILHGELAGLQHGAMTGTIAVHVAATDQQDWFDVRTELVTQDVTLTAAEQAVLVASAGNWVRLGNKKGWRKLTVENQQAIDDHAAHVGTAIHGKSQKMHVLHLQHESLQQLATASTASMLRKRIDKITAQKAVAVPKSLTATLRPYQQHGFEFLSYLARNQFGGILADDMGLGKTIQSLAWLLALPKSTKRCSLVVCPKSVIDNWLTESARFAPKLRVAQWVGNDQSLADIDLVVCSYAVMRLFAKPAAVQQWRAVILDEGQNIKNPKSITAQVACSLQAEHRLVLSGTPLENRVEDVWSLMQFAMPDMLGTQKDFSAEYGKASAQDMRRLSAKLRPFVLRRTKSQVAPELPDRIEEDIVCSLEGVQATLYRAELKRARAQILAIETESDLRKQRFHVLTSLLRLRQLCCHPFLLGEAKDTPSAKISALMEHLESLMAQGHKVLVFSQFVAMLELVQEATETEQYKTFVLTGETQQRGKVVAAFQEYEGPAVFCISLKAGGSGLNLTAASYVVLFDPWWNPAVEAQAIDRTHRIGQMKNVTAYRLIAKDTVEEKIRQLQRHKSTLSNAVLGDEGFANALTLSELRQIFAE
jgi:hypothetical protein